MKSKSIICLLCIATLLLGCNKPKKTTSGNGVSGGHVHRGESLKVLESRVQSITTTGSIPAGETFSVEGSFRIIGHPEEPPSPATIKILSKSPEGRMLIKNEISVTIARNAEQFDLRGEIKAPRSAGSYELQVWYQQIKIGETILQVK